MSPHNLALFLFQWQKTFPPGLINALPWSAGSGSMSLKKQLNFLFMEEFSEEKQSLLPSRPLPCFLTHVQFLLNHFTVAVNWSRSLSSFGWRGWIKRYAFVPGAAKFAVFFVSDQFCGSQRAWKPCENQATGHIFFLKYVQCGYCRWLSLWLLLQWWNQSEVSVNYKRFTKLQGNVNRPALNDGRGHHSASAGEVTTHQTSLHPEPVLIL